MAALPLASPRSPKMAAGAPNVISIFQSGIMRNEEWPMGSLPTESAP